MAVRTPGRHHVETGPDPIRRGGSGRSDHLRHVVSVSRARLRRNSPLRQSGSRNGCVLQPGPPAGAFLHPNPSITPTGCPQAAISGRLPPQTTPDSRSPKTLRQLLHSKVWPATSDQKRRRTAELPRFTHKMLPPALRKRTPARGTRARRRDKARLKPLPSRKNAFVKTGQEASELL